MLRRTLAMTALALLVLLATRPSLAVAGPHRDADSEAVPHSTTKSKKGKAKRAGGKDDDEAPKWDVNDPPGKRRAVTIDTDEGTWMSVDVRPQGDEIAFDLLGDIYVLPIAGGVATPIAAGIAWEMQPRYSPDGEWLAFTSDAGGGDNIWIMRRDGSKRSQVTKEDFRLLNSPAWSPDGQFIAARKHFTSQRSLGTGELWLYHRSGGKGLQMTKKSNDQKDLGEPAFSPDGRYVYFSEDSTPGKYFEYNKDPHGEIYTIKRLDRDEGRIDVFIDGAGGAVRPTPSHDGTRLAFVRRVGLKTGLFVNDIASGANRLLYDDLDRDMQETWAVHGVYPTMAWTPDDAAIVIWAGGKLRRVNTQSSATEVIPFHVDHTRDVADAVRYPVDVAPLRFHTRTLRGVEVAPDGKSVAFQALGRIYIRPLPDGEPRRLTEQSTEFEHDPSFSRDGRHIVYATWDDEQLGAVRVASVADGTSRTVTTGPGHYVEPRFSPDGQHIVFRRVGADSLRTQLWQRDPGLYVVPTDGGDVERITRTGYGAHFGADADRLFVLERKSGEDGATTLLTSVELDGNDRREHVESNDATEMMVSPDGRWLAFREGFHAHITPFVATGRLVEIGPKSEAIPVARVTRDSGAWLHWSGDSSALHWSLGPELYTRELDSAFAFLAGNGADASRADEPAEPVEPAKSGRDIGLTVDAEQPYGSIAIGGAKIVTMVGDEVIDDGMIVVTRNRVTAVGRTGEVHVPPDAVRIDGRGTTIIPGIVDVHYHGALGSSGIIPEQNWSLYATLAFGVTTVHDPSHDSATIFAASEMQRAGLIVGPRIFSTGTILYGAKAPFKAEISSLDDARSHLRRMKALGAISVKSYNQPRRDQRQQVLAAARELDMMVVPEGGSLFQHNMTMVVDGHTGVEHALPIANGYRDIVQLWSGTNVGYTPTIVVGYGGMWGENYWYQHTDVFAHPLLSKFVPPHVLEPRSRRRLKLSDGDWNHFDIARLCKKLSDAGVAINVGAHGQREGLGSHWEMWMLVQGGMTPLEAIRAATLNGARYVGLDGDVGQLRPGMLADLVVVDGDILNDIRLSENVRYTMVNGHLYEASTMDERAPTRSEREPFFWER